MAVTANADNRGHRYVFSDLSRHKIKNQREKREEAPKQDSKIWIFIILREI